MAIYVTSWCLCFLFCEVGIRVQVAMRTGCVQSSGRRALSWHSEFTVPLSVVTLFPPSQPPRGQGWRPAASEVTGSPWSLRRNQGGGRDKAAQEDLGQGWRGWWAAWERKYE